MTTAQKKNKKQNETLCKQLFIFHLFKNFICIVVNNLQTTEKQFAVYNRIVYKKNSNYFSSSSRPSSAEEPLGVCIRAFRKSTIASRCFPSLKLVHASMVSPS